MSQEESSSISISEPDISITKTNSLDNNTNTLINDSDNITSYTSIEEKPITKKISVEDELCNLNQINKIYLKKCGNNKLLLDSEEENREQLGENKNINLFLYPNLDDPNFNIKIAEKKEFNDTKYDGTIFGIEEYAKILSTAEYELLPQQAFVRNFLSFQTPYNSLLLFHGLGSGKTCSAIGVCEEMREYLKQMGIKRKIIIVASPNVQDNFKVQLFDERKLKLIDGNWTMKGCLGNKLLKEINPTRMKGLTKEKVIYLVNNLIRTWYSFQGYIQFSNKISEIAGKTDDSIEQKIRNLQNVFSESLIVIDEVHNIRISDDNENKNVAKNLMFLVSVVSNLRLLLLSATPMFNSYKEIVWLLNLMNMNDKRGIISVSDIFDKDGNFKKDETGNEIGKELLIRKATGYVSYVRGENPYTFPFRIFPDRFAPNYTFKNIDEYPKYQINGKKIPNDRKINKLSLYLTAIGNYQQLGYKYIIEKLREREERIITTKRGITRKMAAFTSLKSFGYTDLQLPIESLNIIYPIDGLEDLVKDIRPIDYINDEEINVDDISPVVDKQDLEKDIIEEIDDIVSNGPEKVNTTIIEEIHKNPEQEHIGSEIESEPIITEGINADTKMFEKVHNIEMDKSKIESYKSTIQKHKKTSIPSLEFEIEDEDEDKDEENISPELIKSDEIDIDDLNISDKLDKSDKLTISDELDQLAISDQLDISDENISNNKDRQIISKKIDFNKIDNIKNDEGIHIIEGETKSDMPTILNKIKETILDKEAQKEIRGGFNEILQIDPKELTGTQGLQRIMSYTDSKTPSFKGNFEYKKGVPKVFNQNEIGKYSSKIRAICQNIYNTKTNKVSDGIILIYSAFIDAGIIPVALALEEMGFTRYGKNTKPLFKNPPTPVVDVRTMKEPLDKRDFKPARYIMITGDTRISPNNDFEMKGVTSDNNLNGEEIKVVLITQAGSEGLDFKALRQVHILDPWYNVNRIEQIIGRAVRNFSHKDLPFEKRNVEIFLHGTILENSKEEAVDLYVYRTSEIKAVKIGKVTRLLKQTSVDCIINHEQIDFTNDNFKKIEENINIKQLLSDHQVLTNFEVGDMDNSATCDFMHCQFDCLPSVDLNEEELNYDTYNEAFMLINSDKIIQKIKNLMKIRYFYKKKDLFQLINIPKKYPPSQIYSALTQIITDGSEYLIDKYGRIGYLINIGEYYLFQPSELTNNNISIYDRSIPIDYKHQSINFEIKNEALKPVIDKRGIKEFESDLEEEDKSILSKQQIKQVDKKFDEGKKVFSNMLINYKLAFETTKVPRGNDNWYLHCGIIMHKLSSNTDLINEENISDRLEILEKFLVEHIVDSLMMSEKINLLNYFYSDNSLDETFIDEKEKRLYLKSKEYLFSKIIVSKGITGIVMFDGPSRRTNLNVYILNKNTKLWIPAEPEDKRDLESAILNKYKLQENLNKYVGFIGFETNKKYMVYKIKDTENKRSTGFRCDQSGKDKIMKLLNDIENDNKYISKQTKDNANELCVRQEFTLRYYNYINLDDLVWFLDTETAIINEFEKKEK